MQKKLIINKDDLDHTAILPLKDLNNLLKQVDIIHKMAQSVIDQLNALGIDGYSFNVKCVSLKDYHVNDKDELIVQSKCNE